MAEIVSAAHFVLVEVRCHACAETFFFYPAPGVFLGLVMFRPSNLWNPSHVSWGAPSCMNGHLMDIVRPCIVFTTEGGKLEMYNDRFIAVREQPLN